MTYLGRGTMIAPYEGSRAQLAAAAVNVLQTAGLRVAPGTGWEDFDARLHAGQFVTAKLVTADHPQGWVQLRVLRRLRWRLSTALAITGAAAFLDPVLALVLVGAVLVETARGLWRTGRPVTRALVRAAG
jgi:hypothetical protein